MDVAPGRLARTPGTVRLLDHRSIWRDRRVLPGRFLLRVPLGGPDRQLWLTGLYPGPLSAQPYFRAWFPGHRQTEQVALSMISPEDEAARETLAQLTAAWRLGT